jgi:peptidyl-prolyl cis-trans isomerase C
MKNSKISLALLSGLIASTTFAAEPAKLAAPAATAPKAAAPAAKSPAAQAPTDKEKTDTAAQDKTAAAGKADSSLKIPDIEKVTHGRYNQSHVDALVKNILARSHQPLTPELKEMIRNNLISQSLVAQEAHKQGFDKQPELKAQITLVGDTVLVGAFVSDYFKHNPVTDAEVKKEYDSFVAQNAKKKEYQVRHILVEKEEDAKQIIEQLKKGEAFDKLAKQHTKDEGSKANGGDLGWSVPQDTFVKPFADAVIALEKGKFTQTPVKSQFGYHVIQLMDIRGAQPPSFEQSKAGIQERLKAKKLEQYLLSLRNKSK